MVDTVLLRPELKIIRAASFPQANVIQFQPAGAVLVLGAPWTTILGPTKRALAIFDFWTKFTAH